MTVRVLRAALTAVFLGTAAVAALVPTVPAQAQATVSAHVGTLLQEAQSQAKAGNWRGAMAKVNEAWVAGNMGPARRLISDGVYVRFQAQLALLNATTVIEDLTRLVGGDVVTLLCHCQPEDLASGLMWCHLSYASRWLQHEPGIAVVTWGTRPTRP